MTLVTLMFLACTESIHYTPEPALVEITPCQWSFPQKALLQECLRWGAVTQTL